MVAVEGIVRRGGGGGRRKVLGPTYIKTMHVPATQITSEGRLKMSPREGTLLAKSGGYILTLP